MAEQERRRDGSLTESGMRRKKGGKMVFLFVSLLLVILLAPLLHTGLPGHAILPIAFVGILIFGINIVSDSRKHQFIAVGLGIPLAIGYVIAEFVPTSTNTSSIALTFGVPFFIYVTYRLLSFVANAQKVGTPELYASACVYLMFGFCWAGIYGLVHYLQPESFNNPAAAARVCESMFYVSFVTLTTLGNGDITPATELTRHLAILEAITGVLTLSFLIARIVSLYKREE